MRRFLLLAVLATTAFAEGNNVQRLSKYILTVANFEKSWAFYHALGLEFDNATELRKPGAGTGVMQLTNTPAGTTFRAQLFKIPGAEFAVEFTEFTTTDNHPARPRIQDPGAAILILRVRDLDKAAKAALANGGEMVTPGGKPMNLVPNNKMKFLFLRDPDGFFVELQQPDPIPASWAPASSNILSAAFANIVDDAAKAASFYKEKMGWEAKIFPAEAGDAGMKVVGLKSGKMQRSEVTVPGSNLAWEFVSYSGVERKPYALRVADTGAAGIAMVVNKIDDVIAPVKAAGGSVFSAGGEPVRRPNGSATGFVRDPNGILLEVIQNAPANAVRLSKYILTVSDLEKTFAFYHDALGISADGNSTIKPPQKGAGANAITGSPVDSSFRNLNTKIPGTDFIFEFIELTGQPRTAHQPRIQDPGASLLILTVRDVDAALVALKQAGAKVITAGGAPLELRPGMKAVFVSDPDGFFVELMQGKADAGSNMVQGARWGRVVESAAKSASFYRDRFGMSAKIMNPVSGGNFLKLVGLDKGELAIATVETPGRPEVYEFFEFRGVDRQSVKFNVPDPGSLQMGFLVRDVEAAAAAHKAAGGAIVSTGGELIRRPNGTAMGLIRDPDGVYLETAPAPKQ
jgi:predicted enzyme related to lactoylglutathione lyase